MAKRVWPWHPAKRVWPWHPAWVLTVVLIPILASAQQAEPEPPPRFEEVCFGDFDDQQEYPTPAELKELFARVPGEAYEISETTRRLESGERRISHIAGVFRLKTPWEPDTTLRLSLLNPGLFQLHFWSGQRGVTLRYCPPAVKTWGAYGTTRQGKGPRPATYADWAVDCGRYCRAGLGTVEVRYHDGNIVLTRGDLRLLSVPLEGLPTEVYLQGSGLVRGVLIYRSTGGPASPEASPVVLSVPKPAEQDWETKLPQGATFEKLPDGAVELAAGENVGPAQAGLDIPGPGLYEYIFELENPRVGTGVYLGNQEGTQLARLAFYRDTATGRTVFAYLGPELAETELEFDFERAMVPYAGEHQWVRLTLGAGVMKCWTTGDGVHWSQSIWSPLAVQGPVTQVGLYCIATEQKRSIKLRSFEIRRLDALASLAPEEIQRRVGSLANAETIEDWDRRAAKSQPPDVPAEVWQRACILRTLAENPYFSLGGVLIHRLLRGILEEGGDLPSQLKLLDEAAILIHSLDEQGTQPFQGHYERLGMRLIRGQHPDPLGVISRAVMRTPIWNYDRQNPWPDRLLRHELISRLAEDRPQEVQRLFGSLRYWIRPEELEGGRQSWGGELQHLIDWAEFQLARRRAGPEPGEQPAVPVSWRGPLIEHLSKEGYNILAEFQAALDAGAYREACQIVAASAGSDVLGLLPDPKDHRLLVSLPAALELAMRRVPELRQAMQEHFGTLGELRLKKAITTGDPAAAEAVTLQFCGTAAAAGAHLWLGDRDLSSGRIAQAASHYRQALENHEARMTNSVLSTQYSDENSTSADSVRHSSFELRALLDARLRLAGAMLGEDVGEPITVSVEIGQMQISAREFEQLVKETRRGQGSVARGQGPFALHPSLVAPLPPHPVTPSPVALRPSRFALRPWARLDGNEIERPPGMPERGLDWAARQTAAVVVGGQMIVNNQLGLAAFELETGKRRWLKKHEARITNDERTTSPHAVRHSSFVLSHSPVVSKQRIFVRRLTGAGVELACFDTLQGTLIWNSRPSDYVASDPLPVGQDLFALTVGRDEDAGRKVSLLLAEFDPRSGRLRRETPLAEFHDCWDGNLPCRASAADGKIVATVAGCVVCSDLSGQVAWIRRQIWIPPPARYYSKATTWFHQRHEAPLVADGRVYATQPGVWNVECLDLQTGQLLWREAVPELTALAGRIGQRLIVETTDGLLALDATSGKTLWRHDAENRLEARLCGPEVGVVYVQLAPVARASSLSASNTGRMRVLLVSVDPASGKSRGTSVLDAPRHEEPLFGPLVTFGGRSWGFFAGADHPARREILELIPETKKN